MTRPHFLSALAIAPVSGYGGFNTSLHRVNSLRHSGVSVKVIDSAVSSISPWQKKCYQICNRMFRKGIPIRLPDYTRLNRRIINIATGGRFDLVWIDKGLLIDTRTLQKLKELQPDCCIVGFSPDDMYARHNQSVQFLRHLPYYDVFFTTKSYNVNELKTLGCRSVVFSCNGYDAASFRPMHVEKSTTEQLGGDIGFIGSYEPERAASMRYLADSGVVVRVWGDDWERMKDVPTNLILERRRLTGDDFARACSAFKINLCFLRKMNRDLQTTRSVEIPGCGGFLLAERTSEHAMLFHEGYEAEFFESDEELLQKCEYYLAHEEERETIAAAGRKRCLRSGYSNDDRIRQMLEIAANVRK